MVTVIAFFVAVGIAICVGLYLEKHRTSEVRGARRFGLAAVGESHYQPALRAVAGKGEVQHECQAELVLEDGNRYDALAVRVDVQGRTVAYLSRDDARKYRSQVKQYGNLRATCAAKIFGGGKGRSLGIWLDIPTDDED
jgi:hypothetical protein